MSEYIEDQDAATQELMLNFAVEKVVHQPVLKPTGTCYNCLERVGGCRLFCDVDCREDYEKIQRSERMTSR